METTGELDQPMKIALYIRVSTEEQAERYGISLQRESLMALIKSRGKLRNGNDAFVLAGDEYIYIDDGISGTVPVDGRPAFSKLKEDLMNAPEGAKPFDAVAVFKIDRFARKLKILLDIIDFFEDYDVKFLSANESIDTSTPFGKAILGIIGVIAELELETTKLRTSAGREEAVKQGKAMGAVAPYGFKKDIEGRLEKFDPEAEVIERIFDLFVNKKMSTQGIASLFTDEGLNSPSASAAFHKKTKFSNKKTPNEFWRSERIIRIIRDERYIGNYFYNRFGKNGKAKSREDWKLSDYRLPLIISPLLFKNAQSLLESQKHERKASPSDHIYILSGLLKCATCHDGNSDHTYWVGGRKKTARGNKEFTYFYQCGRKNKTKYPEICPVIPIPAQEVEQFILAECIRLVSNPLGVFKYQNELASSKQEIKKLQKDQKHWLALLNAIPQRRSTLREQHHAGIIDIKNLQKNFDEILIKEKELRERLNKTEERLSQKTLSEGYASSFMDFAKKYEGQLNGIEKNRERAYTFLHAIIDSIEIQSRPVWTYDKIAGKKKKGQRMPERIQIKLKLPQEFLNATLWDLAEGSRRKIHNGEDDFSAQNSIRSKYNLILIYNGLDKKFRRIAINQRTKENILKKKQISVLREI